MFRSSTSRYAILIAATAGSCGFLHSLPLLGSLPTEGSLASAARGIAALEKLDGFGAASAIDLLAARLWQSGGAPLLSIGEWLATFAGWSLAAFVALAIVFIIAHLLDDWRTRGILLGSAILLLLMTCVPPLWETISKRDQRISDLRLLMPLELVNRARAQEAAKVFANRSALPHLLLLAPNLARNVSPTDSLSLSTNAARWREGLRRAKWNIVVLSGPLPEYRPETDGSYL